MVPVPRINPIYPDALSAKALFAARSVATVSFTIDTLFFDTSWPRLFSSASKFSPSGFPMTSGAFISLENKRGMPSWFSSILAAYEKQKPILSDLSISLSTLSASIEKNSFAETSLSTPGIPVFLKSEITAFLFSSNVTRHVLKFVPPASRTITLSPGIIFASGET